MIHDTYSILNTLLDGNKWPTYAFDTDQMHKLAQEAYARHTFDGYLSYVLMTNQICEEYTRVLVKEGQFTLLLHLVPRGFNWKFPQSQEEAGLNKLMFGKLLEILENSIDFDAKREFIESCRSLNGIRNRLAHQLAQTTSIDKLQRLAVKYKNGYEEVTHLFNRGDDEFSWHWSMMIQDVMWDHITEKECASSDEQHRTKWLDLTKRLSEERVRLGPRELRGQFIRNI